MKVGGGLNYVTGPMGSGKSLFGVRQIVAWLLAGNYAVTNVELLPGWEERVAWHTCKTSSAKRRRVAERLQRGYVFETDLHEAMRYRVRGRGEARAVFVWDESHNDLNNRTYRERDQALLHWATQLRKLGFVGFLLSQSHENTDAQLRRICNHLIRLQNQRETMRVLGLRVTPWPLFIASWFQTHVVVSANRLGKQSPVKVDRYFLDWHRKLYDTFGLYHGLAAEDEAGVIVLPDLSGAPGSPAERAPGRPGDAHTFPTLPALPTRSERAAPHDGPSEGAHRPIAPADALSG